jgi:hypothetical protein
VIAYWSHCGTSSAQADYNNARTLLEEAFRPIGDGGYRPLSLTLQEECEGVCSMLIRLAQTKGMPESGRVPDSSGIEDGVLDASGC